MFIVKGVMQEEHVAHFHADGRELPAKLLEGVGSQSACDDGAKVLCAKLDLNGSPGMQRKRDVAHGAKMVADRATFAIGARDERLAFADGQRFQTVRAERLARNAVPKSRIVAATAARNFW